MDASASDFSSQLDNLSYAFGVPCVSGVIKTQPSDFIVNEMMEIQPSGEGEHFWLDVSKTGLSTDRVAKALARFANVAYRDVGYAGMKDVQAITRQWFSVWMPKQGDFDWRKFSMPGVEILTVTKHQRKLKRGAHKGNAFRLRLSALKGDIPDLSSRLQEIQNHGVPNYFGEQRFGREASNVQRAMELFESGQRIKDRNLKSLVLSSARSFLFNLVVSMRVRDGSWRELFANEPAALDGSNGTFISNNEPENAHRLATLDIHPTAPMWGRGAESSSQAYSKLAELEQAIIAPYKTLAEGLEKFGLEYQRRALRSVPHALSFTMEEDSLVLEFELQTGQFATSVVRELIFFET